MLNTKWAKNATSGRRWRSQSGARAVNRRWYFVRRVGMLVAILGIVARAGVGLLAHDWPEFRGSGRLGVWTETGIIDKFPEGGLRVLWRTPVRAGYAGPAVADGRVFVVDYEGPSAIFLSAAHIRPVGPTAQGVERLLALDERTGRVLWTREWSVNYSGIGYPVGPRATPTVDGNRVYVVGADGKLWCFNARSGDILWQKDFVVDLGAKPESWGYHWGFSSSPLVDGNRLICLVGGNPNALAVAFDKMSGKELWRAIASDGELGVAQPIIITAGGARQLIVWHPAAVVSLNPENGQLYWEQPYKVPASMTIATPVQDGRYLLFSNFYTGSLMLTLDDTKPAATVLWKGKSDSEIDTDGLHAVTATPVIVGDCIYGICSYGQFRCLNAKTGQRI